MSSLPATFTTVHTLKNSQRQRRERLLVAAWELAAEGGYAAVTMHAVADRSQVARATLYRYFGSKDQLLTAVGAEWTRQANAAVWRPEAVAAESAAGAAERVAAFLAEIVERTAHEMPLASAVVSAVISGDPTADRERRVLYELVLGRLEETIGTAVTAEDRAEIVALLGQLVLGAVTGQCLLHQSLEQVRDMLTGAAHRLLP
ncbi:TetR/AcrR family transcriptional regulator [Nocardia uniformis]|uniref:TetR/AcrR family transcriptional regulator n=1 Tax=Nocardia uniformis TaxID=53432 RepID=A0A849C299_9NOCA|nr:TetR/AcrR family transcriptional regulator [Nocardia uniformis]NNH69967.1 TetR/AcrR family transcriptional regulator [Nocardia uniformis]